MYAVTGITCKVGGIVARTLLAAGLPVLLENQLLVEIADAAGLAGPD